MEFVAFREDPIKNVKQLLLPAHITTSKREQDRKESYGLNVAGYMVKGEVGQGFSKAVEMLDRYWRVVELP